MVWHEYGKEEGPVIVMLHPIGIAGEKFYELIGSRLTDEYCFLVPDLGNHGDDYGNYESAGIEALSLYCFLMEKGYPEIALLYGASVGALTALELLKYKDLRIRYVYLDGAPVARLRGPARLLYPLGLFWQKKIFAKGNYTDVKEFLDRWGRDVTEHMASSFERFTGRTIRCIGSDCVRGTCPALSEDIQKHMYLEWGSEELYAQNSPKKAAKLWPMAHIVVRRNYHHCEYMMKETGAYVSFIEKILRQEQE